MANKRDLKKYMNGMINHVVDECIFIQEYNPKKTEAADQLIDEVVDFRDEFVEKVNQAKSKKDFNPIHTFLEESEEKFIQKLSSI